VQRNIGYHRSSSVFEGDPIGSWHALPAAPQLSLLRRPPSTRPGFLPDRGAFTTPNEAFRFCTHVRAYSERARLGDILSACVHCVRALRGTLSREEQVLGNTPAGINPKNCLIEMKRPRLQPLIAPAERSTFGMARNVIFGILVRGSALICLHVSRTLRTRNYRLFDDSLFEWMSHPYFRKVPPRVLEGSSMRSKPRATRNYFPRHSSHSLSLSLSLSLSVCLLPGRNIYSELHIRRRSREDGALHLRFPIRLDRRDLTGNGVLEYPGGYGAIGFRVEKRRRKEEKKAKGEKEKIRGRPVAEGRGRTGGGGEGTRGGA